MTAENGSTERSPLLGRTTSTATNGEHEVASISTLRGTIIVALVGFLVFMQAANMSMISTIQSSIAIDLDSFENASWFTSSYLIAVPSLAPLMGRLSQVFTPRSCIFSSTLLLCLGSAITASSMTFSSFIAGRFITGAGGGGMYIVASIMSVQMTSPKRRGVFVALVNTGMTIGVSLGAILAGALEPRIGWKPLFGAQAPLSLLCGIGLLLSIPANHTLENADYSGLSIRDKLKSIDYSGAILLTTTIVPFLLGLSGPKVAFLPLVLSAFALPVFILNEIYGARDPIIPVSVLSSRATLLTCLATVGFMMARWSVLFYTPVYAIAVRGWTPAVAGSILIPTNAGFASGGITVGILHIKRTGSFYLPTLIATATFPLTMLVIAYISTPTSQWELYVATVFLNGFATGAAVSYALVHLLHLTLPEVHPIVISLVATFRGFAGSFGSAIGGGYFVRVLKSFLINGFARAGLEHREELTRQLLGRPALVSDLIGAEKDVAVTAYKDALRALFLAAVGLSTIMAMVQAGTGWKAPIKNEEDTGEAEENNSVEEEFEGEEGLLVAA